MLKSLRLKAYAKLNPSLYVGARRFDGFHPLESAAVTVDVADIVTVSQTDSGRIESDYCGGVFIPEQTDSAVRAARMFFQTASVPFKGLKIKTEKHIGLMAGMGGSSADAAAVLTALGLFYGCEKNITDEAARRTGSDICFLMKGGAALMSGKGDDLTEFCCSPNVCFVVVRCGRGLSTKDVFSEFDRSVYVKWDMTRAKRKCLDMLGLMENGDADGINGTAYNSLFKPAAALCRELEETARKAESLGAPLIMTGSGSAMFCAFDSNERAASVADAFNSAGLSAFVCRPTRCGVEVVD